LEQILPPGIWEPELGSISFPSNLFSDDKSGIDPLISSLLDQIGETPHRRRYKMRLIEASPQNLIYQLKITLKKIDPPIWRRILVAGDISLPRLHAVLQIVMGWTNSHLHGFEVGKVFYTEPDPDYGEESNIVDERQVRLSQIAPQVGSHFVYEYDFGDSWDHEIVVEHILPPDEKILYPHCIDGKRACPHEDVGGPFGYAEFLAAIHDRKHPKHTALLAWAGGKFNSEKFDLLSTNELLQLFQSQFQKG
jgi:hypothetical protein